MPKYIDSKDLMTSLYDWWYSSFGLVETEESKAIKRVIDKVEKYIDAQPSDDVVELVRCKDCQFASLTYDGDCKYCRYLENEFDLTDAVYFDANDYCSHGERVD